MMVGQSLPARSLSIKLSIDAMFRRRRARLHKLFQRTGKLAILRVLCTNKSLQVRYYKLFGLNEDHEIYSAKFYLTATSIHSQELPANCRMPSALLLEPVLRKLSIGTKVRQLQIRFLTKILFIRLFWRDKVKIVDVV